MAVKQTIFWYDLETTGTNAREGRIMQFAGQRTDLSLVPVGEPVNVLIRLAPDILPEPDAILITGITPQMTLADGMTEAEFLRYFAENVAIPGTIFTGFNSVRFDDEFMRFLHWRNFYDAYGWEWKDGRGRWDLLDVVRMTRALRPEGIEWPIDGGKASNRLELLTKANGLAHENAHDALSDVQACIAVAKLIKEKQPKLYDYLFAMRDKKRVAELVERDQPFTYTSGKYDAAFDKTSVAVRIAANPSSQGALVYDLRHDPSPFIALSPAELVERWKWIRDENAPARLPVKTLQYNRCPALAPLSVLDAHTQARLKIDLAIIAKHRDILRDNPQFVQNVLEALTIMDSEREQWTKQTNVDARLYDGFVGDKDVTIMSVLRAAAPEELTDIGKDLADPRLKELLPLYKARNFPRSLTDDERAAWDAHCYQAIMEGGTESRLAKYMHRLQQLSQTTTNADKRYLLEELQLYAESIIPAFE